MSASPNPAQKTPRLEDLDVSLIDPNDQNPRLDFPQEELDRLAESIDQEGILVPIVVYSEGSRYVLVDGERRFKCATQLGLKSVPAVVVPKRNEREVLQQMFNIHLIREQWRDIPTAKALERLHADILKNEGREPSEKELAELTGLSLERVQRLRYVVTLPDEWQQYVRDGEVPLNYFWEVKKNVLDALLARRPALAAELGIDNVREAFVDKRLSGAITDTVSLRKVAPIIRIASEDAARAGTEESTFDDALRDLMQDNDTTIEDVYQETVQVMVEVEKLGRRGKSMAAVYRRLLELQPSVDDRRAIHEAGRSVAESISDALDSDIKAIGPLP